MVHLHGVLEGGRDFFGAGIVGSGRTSLYAERIWGRLGGWAQPARFGLTRRTFAGESVARVELGIPQDAPPLRERLHRAGIDTFEADVRFAVRYLIDRGIRGGCEIRGAWDAGGRTFRAFMTTRNSSRPTLS